MATPGRTAGGAVLADTHAFIWYVRDDRRLSAAAGSALDATSAAGHPILVAAVTVVEIRYLTDKGTFREDDFVALLRLLQREDSAFLVAPLTLLAASAASRLPRDHVPDPFDRMIAGTAVALGVPLVTEPSLPTLW